MNVIRRSVVIALTVTIVGLLGFLVQEEFTLRNVKGDLVEISKAKYGLFNVDEWKSIITNIVHKRIEEFQLTEENKELLREKISLYLHEAIDNYEEDFEENENRLLRRAFVGLTNGFDRLRKSIPEITESIILNLEEPDTRDRLQAFSLDLIDQYADDTFSEVDYSEFQAILIRHKAASKAELLETLNVKQEKSRKEIQLHRLFIYSIVLILIIWLLVDRNWRVFDLKVCSILAVFLLVSALTLPMIDIDARVQEFSFSILGEPVSFQDQVLYYKSKSILEVVRLMMTQNRPDVLVVGFLVLTFSVLFPLVKLVLSFFAMERPAFLKKRVVKFFVLKSGKWSMADVMVVAIFMSYIGFSSILSEQLSQLQRVSDNLEVLTTNKSVLNTGFFLFALFVLLSLVISTKIQKLLTQEK